MSVLERLRDLRSGARRLIWLGGLSGAGSVLLFGLLVCSALDWWWHVDARWLRAGLLAAVICFVGRCLWRRLWQPLRQPMSNVEISGRLEQQFPMLRGRLASTVEFLEHGVSPQLGSPELQQRLIDATTADVAQVNFAEVLDRREATRSAWQFAAVASVVVLLAMTNRGLAATALSRLLWPMGDRPWPREVELRFARADSTVLERDSATRLKSVQGQSLDLFVVNIRGDLPQSLRLEFRRSGFSTAESVELHSTQLRDAADRTQAAAAVRLPVESGTIELRAIGGDDRNMPWRTLELIPLARLKSFRIKVIPPTYTGEPAAKWADGVTQIKASVGSKLLVEGTLSRAIRGANWSADATTVRIANKTELQTERLVSQAESTTWRLTLTDTDGFENPNGLSLSVIGVADPPPTVSFDEPSTDQTVTPQAVLRLAATAKDDRGLRDVHGEHRAESSRTLESSDGRQESNNPGASPPTEVSRLRQSELANGEAIVGFHWPESPDGTAPTIPSAKQVTLRHEWPLADLSLQPGDRVRLQVLARDACDFGEPRVGRSVVRTLTIVSAETKAAEIAGRLDLLLQDLLNLAERQTSTQSQTTDLRVQFDKTLELRPEDRDSLKRIDLDQRQIDLRLIGRDDGVVDRARHLLADLETNRLTVSSVQQRLSEVAQMLEQLGRESLPPLEAALREIVKSLADASRKPDRQQTERLAERFATASNQQAAVFTVLNSLVRDLTQWRDRRELAREIAELANSQRSLSRDTAELAPQTLGHSATELSSQQQADLAKLADRQARQAERVEQLHQRLLSRANEAAAENSESAASSNSATQAARDTAAELEKRAIAARTREAARDVAANNLGQAGTSQQQAGDDLQTLADKLQDQTTSPAATADQVAESVRDFVARQQKVIDETARLSGEQAQVGKWTRPLSKAVLHLAEAEKSLSDAVRELQKSISPERISPTESQPANETSPRNAGSLILDRAARDLSAAAAGLRDKRLDDETRTREQAALRRLKSLAEALSLKLATENTADSEKEPSPDSRSNPDQPQSDVPVPPVAQLKLLRQLQAEIRDETEQADANKPQSNETTDHREAQVQQLTNDQKQVSDATRQLLDRIPAEQPESPDSTPPDEATPRDGALSAMRRSADGLSRRDTGKPTQAHQQQAVSQLDTLLKLWQQRTDTQQHLARTGQPVPMPNQNGDPNGDPNSTASDGNPGQSRGKDNPQAQTSSDRDNTGADRETLARRDRQLREAIWGHLPPALREKMLNLPHDKLLPKYADHIRRYYEALAEER